MLAKISKRYARAIFSLVDDKEKQSKILKDLDAVVEAQKTSPELKLLFESEAFSSEQKAEVAGEVGKALACQAETVSALKVLAEAGRLRALEGIAKALRQEILESEGVALLEIRSKDPLEEDERKLVETKFKQILSKEVQSQFSIDPNLVGGIRVKAEGRTFDGSLVTRLQKMKEQLAGGI